MKTAIVTGGGGALGKAISLCLAAQQWRIIVVDRVEAYAAETMLALDGHPAEAHIADVADEAAIASMVQAVAGKHGTIEGLVNCAGGAHALRVPHGPFVDSDPEHWDRFIDVNLYGGFALCREVGAIMKANRYGRIVNISSGAGLRGGPPKSRQAGAAVYSATKAGVVAFTQALAQELGAWGIRVNAVAPGRNESRDKPLAEMLRLLKEEESREAGSGRLSPLGRYGRPHDIGEAVAFLMSDHSDYITGSCLDLTGGIRLY